MVAARPPRPSFPLDQEGVNRYLCFIKWKRVICLTIFDMGFFEQLIIGGGGGGV